jgi:hypothetical protein
VNRFKEWLANANGWQRIWFVGSLLFILYSFVIWPVNNGGAMYYGDYFKLRPLEKNPECQVFFNKPFDQLVKPP